MQRRRKGQQCLARAGLAGERHQLEIVIGEGIEGEGLLGVPRVDPVGALLVYAPQHSGAGDKGNQSRTGRALDHEKLVGHQRLLQIQARRVHLALRAVEVGDHVCRRVLDGSIAPLEGRQVGHVIGGVVLGHQANGLGLHAQIHVLADQNHLPVGVVLGVAVRRVEDCVVGLLASEHAGNVRMEILLEADHDVAETGTDGQAAVEQLVGAQGVKRPHKLPRVKIEAPAPLLEAVQFLYHGDWNEDVVVLELVDAAAVVKNDVGVEYKDLLRS
jgi:hypothetical protein